MSQAVLPSSACTARKSRSAAAGHAILAAFQTALPSTVRKYVPPVPLAHATDESTTLTPRSEALVPLACATHV